MHGRITRHRGHPAADRVRFALAIGLASCLTQAAIAQQDVLLGPPALIVAADLSTSLVVGAEWLQDPARPFAFPGHDAVAVYFLAGPADPSLGPGSTEGFAWNEVNPVAARRFDAAMRASSLGVIELADGQRVTGGLYVPAGESDTPRGADAVRWTPFLSMDLGVSADEAGTVPEPDSRVAGSSATGIVELPLDEVRRVLTPAARRAGLLRSPGSVEDEIVLANGDRLSGFVVSLDPDIVLEADGNERHIDPGVVGSVVLGNPPQPLDHPTVWLADGTVASVVSARFEGDELLLDTEHFGKLAVPPWMVMAYAADPQAVVPLASLEPEQSAGGSDRYFVEPVATSRHPGDALPIDIPAIGVLDVVLPGPMRLVYAAPEGSAGIVATVELPTPVGRWADCDLVVMVNDIETERLTLNRETPAAALRVPLAGAASIEILLDERLNGPIGDRVILRRPMFIIDPNR